jgi:hypothetical protein
VNGLLPRIGVGVAALLGVATAASGCGASGAERGGEQSSTGVRNVTASAVDSVRSIESTFRSDLARALSQFGATPDLTGGQSVLDAYRAAANGLAAIVYPNAAAKSDAVIAERDLNSVATGFRLASGANDGGADSQVAVDLTTLNTELGLPPFSDIPATPLRER